MNDLNTTRIFWVAASNNQVNERDPDLILQSAS